jgi:hypothetical protein
LTLIFQGAIPYGFTGNLKAPQEVIAAAWGSRAILNKIKIITNVRQWFIGKN